MTEEQTQQATQVTPFDDFFDKGSEFPDIPNGTYCWEISGINKIKRDSKGTLRAEFELTVKGDVVDNEVVESDCDGRKTWENGALEGIQIEYFTAKLLRAIRERNPDKTTYIDAVPFLPEGGKLSEIAVSDGAEINWENYLMPFVGLDVIVSLRINKKETDKGFGTKYYKNFPKDQSAGL